MHESDSQRSGCLSGSAFVSKLVNMPDHEALRAGAKTFSGSHYDIDVQALTGMRADRTAHTLRCGHDRRCSRSANMHTLPRRRTASKS